MLLKIETKNFKIFPQILDIFSKISTNFIYNSQTIFSTFRLICSEILLLILNHQSSSPTNIAHYKVDEFNFKFLLMLVKIETKFFKIFPQTLDFFSKISTNFILNSQTIFLAFRLICSEILLLILIKIILLKIS